MKIKVEEIRVASVRSELPTSIVEELIEMEAKMYDNEGFGQYSLSSLVDKFDEDTEEHKALNSLIEQGYDYLEYC